MAQLIIALLQKPVSCKMLRVRTTTYMTLSTIRATTYLVLYEFALLETIGSLLRSIAYK